MSRTGASPAGPSLADLLGTLREQVAGLRALTETQFTSVDHRFDSLGKRIDKMETASNTSHLDTARRLDELRVLVGEQGMVLKDHERRITNCEARDTSIGEDIDQLSAITGEHHVRQETAIATRQVAEREFLDGKRFWITVAIALGTAILGIVAGYFSK